MCGGWSSWLSRDKSILWKLFFPGTQLNGFPKATFRVYVVSTEAKLYFPHIICMYVGASGFGDVADWWLYQMPTGGRTIWWYVEYSLRAVRVYFARFKNVTGWLVVRMLICGIYNEDTATTTTTTEKTRPTQTRPDHKRVVTILSLWYLYRIIITCYYVIFARR